MWCRQLRNVYITNLVKCRYRLDNKAIKTPVDIVDKCFDQIFQNELALFQPILIICF